MTGTQTATTNSRRCTRVLMALAMLAAGLLMFSARPAHASTTFTVTIPGDTRDANTADNLCDVNPFDLDTECTLRAAIEQANADTGADFIHFNIPDSFGTGVKTINVGSTGNGKLPAISDQVTINGYTQPGAHTNTRAVGDDAVLRVELNGSGAGASSDGLTVLKSSGSVIQGLVINRFSNSGIFLAGDTSSGVTIANDNRIEGNFIGTDPSGKQDRGNLINGVTIGDGVFSTTVGGTSPSARNIISGNGGRGVSVFSGSAGTRVQGNYVGTDKSGNADLGNTGSGIVAEGANNNTIGGTTAGAGNLVSGNGGNGVGLLGPDNKVLGNRIGTTASGTGPLGNDKVGLALVSAVETLVGDGTSAGSNTIAFNSADGVEITGGLSSGNVVSRNSVFSNGRLGIDLFGGVQDAAGNTANDPGDADSGPNGLQNKPVLTSARKNATGKTVVKGGLNSFRGETFKIQFYSNSSGNEGKKFMGEKTVTTDSTSGSVSFTFSVKRIALGQKITATATGGEGTSEFSAPKKVVKR